jgi:hypothetical protein
MMNVTNVFHGRNKEKWDILEQVAKLSGKLEGFTDEQLKAFLEGLSNIVKAGGILKQLENFEIFVEHLEDGEHPFSRMDGNKLIIGIPAGRDGKDGENALPIGLRLVYDSNTGDLYYKNVYTEIDIDDTIELNTRSRVDSLEACCAEGKVKLADLDAKDEEHEETLTNILEALNSHNELLELHNQKLEQHTRELNNQQRRLREHRAELKSHKNALDNYQTTLSEHEERLSDTQLVLNGHQEGLDNHTTELSGIQLTLNEYQDKIVALETQLAEVIERLNEV